MTTFTEGQKISAYTANNNIFNGYVINREDGVQVALNEDSKWIPLSELKMIRITEDDAADLKKSAIEDAVAKIDKDKWNSASDDDKNKAAEEYAAKFNLTGETDAADITAAINAACTAEDAGVDLNQKTAMDDYMIESMKASKKADIENRIREALGDEFDDEFDLTLDSEEDDFDDEFDYDENDESESFYINSDDEIVDDESEDIDFDDDDTIDEDFTDYEEEADNDIEASLDELLDDEDVEYDEMTIFETLCSKYGMYDKKEKLLETAENSVPDAILKLSEAVAFRRFMETISGKLMEAIRDFIKDERIVDSIIKFTDTTGKFSTEERREAIENFRSLRSKLSSDIIDYVKKMPYDFVNANSQELYDAIISEIESGLGKGSELLQRFNANPQYASLKAMIKDAVGKAVEKSRQITSTQVNGAMAGKANASVQKQPVFASIKNFFTNSIK